MQNSRVFFTHFQISAKEVLSKRGFKTKCGEAASIYDDKLPLVSGKLLCNIYSSSGVLNAAVQTASREGPSRIRGTTMVLLDVQNSQM